MDSTNCNNYQVLKRLQIIGIAIIENLVNSSSDPERPIDLTCDEAITDAAVLQHAVSDSLTEPSTNSQMPPSPVAPPYSPLTPPTR